LARYELAYSLGLTINQLDNLPYEEILGWQEYFSRRPLGWREDNRAAIISMSMGGGKLKPEDLFESLKTLRQEAHSSISQKNFAEKLFDRFSNRFSEKEITQTLRGNQ
jgi:hypothetical protein